MSNGCCDRWNYCSRSDEGKKNIAGVINDKSGAKCEELDEGLLKEVAYGAAGDVCPMAAVIGGITAQEVMKVRPNKNIKCVSGNGSENFWYLGVSRNTSFF